MKPSGMNLSAADFVAFLLLIFLAGDMVPVEATCSRLSGTYRGWCTSTRSCRKACSFEAPYDYYDGKCQGTFPARCWCIGDRCPGAAAPDEGGDGVAAARGGCLVKKEREFPISV
ncbi:hypothetical protein HU200_015959 [Digitaria exilis]|uniref:Knottins-like domain-containing protein n=1 Tax=Digitaria exilis TaxID=1010633 RepID=A0A835F959_9POAL|nr:hypothetical protein HU200_015959 [Digitaria exilis]